jgi:hypothetical protein
MNPAPAIEALKHTLGALADADRHVTGPERIGQAVMDAWDAEHAPRAAGRYVWSRIRLPLRLAAAAALVLLGILAANRPRARPPSPLVSESAPIASESAPVALALPGASLTPAMGSVMAPAARPSASAARRRARRGAMTPARTQEEVGLLLIADPMFDPARATVVSVRMPRSALAFFGLPVAELEAGGDVDVEMIVGEDGIARAIRRVRAAATDSTEESE